MLLILYSSVTAAILNLLFFQVAENVKQKIETRVTAIGFLSNVDNLGFTILLYFWKIILGGKIKLNCRIQILLQTVHLKFILSGDMLQWNLYKTDTL